jgi:recombination protein RecT
MTTKKDLSELQKAPTKARSMKELQALPPKKRVAAFLQDNRGMIQKALPKHVNPERMLQVAQTAVTQTPALLECDTGTLFGALIKCTQLGLEPNNALGQVYMIPFNNRRANRKDVQVVIGYKGMIDLARRSGNVESLQAMAVRDGDEFSYEYGANEHLKHIPGASRGHITHFYAYAKLVGGGFQFEVLPKESMDEIMRATQSGGKYGPWADHYEQMGRKTMVRRLFNYLPVSIEMAQAQALDATGETKAQQLDNVLTDVEYTVVPDSDDMAVPTDEPAQSEAEPEPIVDVNGEIFDPEIHLETASGKPMYNADDSFRKRPQRGKHEDDKEEAPAKKQKAEPEPETTSPPSDDEDGWPTDDGQEPPDDDDFSLE